MSDNDLLTILIYKMENHSGFYCGFRIKSKEEFELIVKALKAFKESNE